MKGLIDTMVKNVVDYVSSPTNPTVDEDLVNYIEGCIDPNKYNSIKEKISNLKLKDLKILLDKNLKWKPGCEYKGIEAAQDDVLLIRLARINNIELIEHLLNCLKFYKANIDLNKEYGDYKVTLLFIATQHGHKELVEFLIKNGAEVNKVQSHRIDLLSTAVDYGHIEVVKILLKYNPDADISALLSMVAGYGAKELIEFLIKNGADVNKNYQNIRTPLYAAAESGHAEIVDLLLKYGAYVDKDDQGGVTPLYVASSEGHTEVVELLVKNGADVNKAKENGLTPLYIAAHYQKAEVVKLLLEHPEIDINQARENGSTPLYIAANSGDMETVRPLVEDGADVNKAKENGLTPLYTAASSGHIEVVKLLVAYGADINKATLYGKTPLDIAVYYKHTEVERFLREQKGIINKAAQESKELSNVAYVKRYKQIEDIFGVKFKEETPKLAFDTGEARYPSKDGGPELAEDFNSDVFNAITLKESKDARLAIKALQKLLGNLDKSNFKRSQIRELLDLELERQEIIYKGICQEKKSTIVLLFKLEELLAIKKLIIAANKDKFSWGRKEKKQLFPSKEFQIVLKEGIKKIEDLKPVAEAREKQLFSGEELINTNDNNIPKDIRAGVKEGMKKELEDLKPIAKAIALVLNMINNSKLQEIIDLAYARVNIDRVNRVVGSKVSDPKVLQLLALTAKDISKVGSLQI
jgi:ankyrin repeat protein